MKMAKPNPDEYAHLSGDWERKPKTEKRNVSFEYFVESTTAMEIIERWSVEVLHR